MKTYIFTYHGSTDGIETRQKDTQLGFQYALLAWEDSTGYSRDDLISVVVVG
jgi:hypothetical protein